MMADRQRLDGSGWMIAEAIINTSLIAQTFSICHLPGL